MAIKKINRDELTKKVNAVKPVDTSNDVLEEETVTENLNDEVNEDGSIEDTDIPADENNEVENASNEDQGENEVKDAAVRQPVKTVTAPVVTKTTAPTVTKTTTPANTNKNTTSNNKGEKKMTTAKKTLGNKAPKVETVERTIGTVYPKDLLIKNIQTRLDERFEGITLADVKAIFDVTEEEVMKASQVASVRIFGGVMKAQERNALVAKAPKVDYVSYTAPRQVITITGAEIGTPDKYRGRVEGNKFVVTESFNHEDGKWYAAEGEIDLDAPAQEE